MTLTGLTAAWLAAAVLAPPPLLHAEGPYLRDAQGAVVILRGINFPGDAKIPPFALPAPRHLDRLPGLGINVVRLLFTWEAFEPRPGAYDLSYLEAYATLVRAAASRGMYVIVDFHQDAMSRFTLGGCGEGFPAWAVPTEPPHAVPDNGWRCANWTMRALFDSTLAPTWKSFYASKHRAAYVAMAARVAQRLAGTPGVLGYDMINEPWGDEIHEIAPLQADVGAAIRALDPNAVLFVSPHVTTSGGLQTDLPRPRLTNFVYSPHFYDSWVMGVSMWMGNTLTWTFARMRQKADAWQVPLFLGEYGAPAGARRVGAFMQTMHDRLNEGLISGAQWCYAPGWSPDTKDGWNDEDLSIMDGRGVLRANFVPRPYPQRIAGTPQRLYVSHTLDPHDNELELEWEHDPGAGDTVVYWPHEAFVGDASLRLQAAGEGLHCAVHLDSVRCRAPSAGPMRLRLAGGP